MKHHYIPQFYLEPWVNRETDNKLTEFRRLKFPLEPLPRLEIKRRGKMETGYVENLYRVPGASKATQQNVERIFMGAVDKHAATARDMMLAGNIPMEPRIRHAWARFLLSLVMRTPEAVKAFKYKVRSDLLAPDPEFQSKYDELKKNDWPPTREEYMLQRSPTLPERQAVIMITKLIQKQNVLKLMTGADWWLLDTSTKPHRKILTSDHPLIMSNGLGRPDGHFALPISPQLVFVAFMNHGIGRGIQRIPLSRLVRDINDAVIGQGRRSVYAFDEDETRTVKRRMGKRDYMSPLPRNMLVLDGQLEPIKIKG
ncbi:DUF4238 domain-containing protein [Rhizobium sp. DKSPLA3]|uniref:DUF4238 domain-containing protein n=1 Tax=Rhizobium quercicola TaxID=2901226 RepID=A0A9X1NXS8_9HYPH|nr:DUF4238 domain-containing protein [Rhizobium quercicola]MCD7111916.1 DUF4238 domain-containing protein [Rhizobium quercicola]